jgi:hypothetical protein
MSLVRIEFAAVGIHESAFIELDRLDEETGISDRMR